MTNKIMVLGKEACSQCDELKMDANKINAEYEYVLITERPDLLQLARDNGARSLPCVFIDGVFKTSGYSKEAVELFKELN